MPKSSKRLSKIKVCRICLCKDRKLYLMKKHNLFLYYEQLTQIDACDEDGLPQRICWECGVRLAAAASFRSKAMFSNELLKDIFNSGYPVPDIARAIDREKYKLTSKLKRKIFGSDHVDFDFVYKSSKIKEITLSDDYIDCETEANVCLDNVMI